MEKSIVWVRKINFYRGSAEESVEDGGLSQEEKSRLYGFALQMIGNRSYAAARNVVLTIRGYKNVDELLAQLDER